MGIGDRDYMRSGSRFPFAVLGAVPTIIALNAGVYLMWHLGSERFMAENFLVSRLHLEAGRWWTLLTAAFSHNNFAHLLLNMFVLYGFGRVIEDRWGPRRFSVFYFGAAIVSSAAHPLFQYFGWPMSFGLGASGAIAGVFTCFALYYPRATILFMMLIPVRAWYLAVLGSAYDLWGLIEQRSGGGAHVGYAAHLAGALCGVFYVLVIERGAISLGGGRPQRRARILRPEESTWRAPDPRDGFDPDERVLDELLDKVSRGGLDSLSVSERETLERISARRRDQRR